MSFLGAMTYEIFSKAALGRRTDFFRVRVRLGLGLKPDCLLCILTSKLVLCTLLAGQNHLICCFFIFFCHKRKK